MVIQTLLAVVLTAQVQPLPPLVGTLTVTSGKVRLERAGRDPQWGSEYIRLRVGDKLTIVEKPRATVRIDATREVWRLPESGSWAVEDRALKKLTGLAPTLIRRTPPLRSAPGTPPQPLAGRIRSSDPQVWPFGAVLRGPVEVTWTKAAGSTKTTVELFNAKGKSLWKQAVASGTKATIPEKHTKSGQWVKVQVLQSGPSPVSSSAWVCVMTSEQRGAVEAEEKALRAALGEDRVALGLALGDLWASSRMASRLNEALRLAFPELGSPDKPTGEVVKASEWQHGQWLEAGGILAEARAAYEKAWDAGERSEELKAAIERLGGTAKPAEWERLAADMDRFVIKRDYVQALMVGERLLGLLPQGDSPERASVLARKAQVLDKLGPSSESLTIHQECLQMLRRVLPDDHLDVLQGLSNVAVCLDALRRSREALPLHQECLEKRRRELSGDHRLLAQSLNNLAYCLDALGRPIEALPLFEESVAMRRRLWEGDHPSIVLALDNLAGCLILQDRSAEALKYFEDSLAMRRRLFEGDNPEVALGLNNLGYCLNSLGRPAEALPLFEQSLLMRRSMFKGDHPDVAQALNNLATCLDALGRHSEALPNHRESLAMARRIFRGDEPEVLEGLSNIATCLEALGHASEALPLHKDSLAMARRVYGDDHALVALGLGNVADCLQTLGRSAEAMPLLVERLAIDRRVHGSDHRDLAQSLNNLATCYLANGRPADALPLLEESLAMKRRLFQGDHASVATGMNNLANTLQALGRYEDALRVGEESLSMRRRLFPGDDSSVAQSLGGVGVILNSLGRSVDALPYYKESLAMRRRLQLGDSFDLAESLNNVGACLDMIGRSHEARAYHDECQQVCRRLYSGDHPTLALSMNNLAFCLMELELPPDALPLFEESLAMQRRLFNGDHPEIAASLRNLVSCLNALGRRDEARSLFEDSMAMDAGLLVNEWSGKTGDSGQLASAASERLAEVGIYSEPITFYRWIPTLRGAGLTLESRLNMARRLSQADPEIRTALGDLQQAEEAERDWLLAPSPKELTEEAWSGHLSELRRERQSAGGRLARMLGGRDPRLVQSLEVTQKQVQSAIDRDETLIEYLCVATWDDKTRDYGPNRYAAFIVPRDGEVRYVRLAPAEKIDELVGAWHEQMAVATQKNVMQVTLDQAEAELKKIGRELYDELVTPLGKLPPNLLIAPDDKLHSLPFAALFDGRKYLVETKALSVVGSGRDLVEKPPTAETKDAVVMAGPGFDLNAASIQDADRDISASQSDMRSVNATGRWDPLPEAGQEGQAVAKLLKVDPILSEKATEARLMSVERPVVLHIATHGFFFPPILERKERDDLRMSDMTGRRIRAADSPMIRSGLILSGANNDEELRKKGLADGWATAIELSQLDLRGTELVVLSACETARGDIKGAEGVFGLQRAFRFAGVQSLLMSLFKVPDDSTLALMTAFYKKWKPGDPAGKKLSALRGAQLSMLKDPKTRHPRNWAGFVLMGER